MSAMSGISVSPELTSEFASAVHSKSIRFLTVSIRNESLVHDLSIPVNGTFEDDLAQLQSPDVLQDNDPTYILAKLDDPSLEWLAISYVPDSARVKDKMLYASTRASLFKSLASTLFTDSMFATSRADLTPEAYAAHKRHISAPKPLSAREKEMAEVRAAESGGAYEGSRARVNHVGKAVGFRWSDEAEATVRDLGASEGSTIVVLQIDVETETLVLGSTSEINIESLGSSIPSSEPSYILFAWPQAYTSPPRREIIFIYCCPTTSSIKYRMVYASGVAFVFRAAQSLLIADHQIASRRIETSNPTELSEAFLKAELGLDGNSGGDTGDPGEEGGAGRSRDEEEKKPFARPKGPARRRP